MELVFVENINAEATMQIVRDLRKMGLVQGRDFEFKYQQARYNNDGFESVSPCGAEFYFREGKWATYCSLKYAC